MKKPHPHPIHSGDFVFEGDHHYTTHNHLHAGAQDALQGCLALIRGLRSRTDREALLGHLLAALIHEGAIDGLVRTWGNAMAGIDHYNVRID